MRVSVKVNRARFWAPPLNLKRFQGNDECIMRAVIIIKQRCCQNTREAGMLGFRKWKYGRASQPMVFISPPACVSVLDAFMWTIDCCLTESL